MQIMRSNRNRIVGVGCIVGLGAVALALGAFAPPDADENLAGRPGRLIVGYDNTYTLTSDETYDYVLIRQGGTLNTAGCTLTITAGGGLIIWAGGELNVNAAGGTVDLTGDGTSVIDGELNLATSTAVLEISADVVLAGGGAIIGTAAGAEISVDAAKTLTSQMRIEGALTIGGTADATTGKFVNDGLVYANRSATPFAITLQELTFLGGGEWRIGDQHASDEINFASGTATGLWGDFTVLGGTLDGDVNVITSSSFHWKDGKIDVASGVEFRAN